MRPVRPGDTQNEEEGKSEEYYSQDEDQQESDEPQEKKKGVFQSYEQDILKSMGVGGSKDRKPTGSTNLERRAHGKSSHSPAGCGDRSGYNSKDSDFSNNDEGSDDGVGDDFGGNHSQRHDDDSNFQYAEDDF